MAVLSLVVLAALSWVALAAEPGTISAFAGDGTAGSSAEGVLATHAYLYDPFGVATDRQGDVFIANTDDNAVEIVPASSCSSKCAFGVSPVKAGHMYTVAGNGSDTYSGDNGPALQAALYGPRGVAVDARGDIVIADTSNGRVRLVARSACSSSCPFGLGKLKQGHIYRVAGNGSSTLENAVPATDTGLDDPQSVAVDSHGDLIIDDENDQLVRVVAGSSCSSRCPFALGTMRKGYIYTIAGVADNPGYTGDDQLARDTELNEPEGVAVDSRGDVLISDTENYLIRLVARTPCSSKCPYGLGKLKAGYIYRFAGNGSNGSTSVATGPAQQIYLDNPTGLAVDARGDLLIDDSYHLVVRLLAASSCSSKCPFGLSKMKKNFVYTIAGTGVSGSSGNGGPARKATFTDPISLAINASGDLFVADTGASVVRKVTGGPVAKAKPKSKHHVVTHH